MISIQRNKYVVDANLVIVQTKEAINQEITVCDLYGEKHQLQFLTVYLSQLSLTFRSANR